MRFINDDKRLIKWMSENKLRRKNACSRCFW